MSPTTSTPYSGIAPGAHLGLQNLGHQGGNLVIDHSDAPKKPTDDPKVNVVSIDRVFADPTATFIVFGTPNVSLLMPMLGKDSWLRMAAYMFWRNKTSVVPTKGRVQAGVFCELVGLNHEARQALESAVISLVGTRKASCAHSVALALHRAGFRLGKGSSLTTIYRPSHLAAALWREGVLFYRGEVSSDVVQLRWVTTDQSVHEHFLATWKREYFSFCRLVEKYFKKGTHSPAPVLEPRDESHDMSDAWPTDAPTTTVAISKPSRLGVNLSYVLGEQPEFSVSLPRPLNSPALAEPLKAFPGKLNKATKLKRFVLFNELMIWLMRGNLVRDKSYHKLPVPVILDMLRKSPTPERNSTFVYNFVLLPYEIRLKRLLNNSGHDNKFVAWLLAKHVLLSGWSKRVRLAGELWACTVDGVLTIYLLGESGTYQPENEQLIAAAEELSATFKVPVIPVLRSA